MAEEDGLWPGNTEWPCSHRSLESLATKFRVRQGPQKRQTVAEVIPEW